MRRLLLLSILIATVAIPALAARDPQPARGLKRALFFALAFDLFYAVSVSHLYMRL